MLKKLYPVAATLVLASTASAQPGATFPTKPIRLITITAPGGSLDILARTIGQNLSEQMGQPVVVENRTGAGGNIGAEALAKSEPDGYTIGMITSSTHGINPSLFGASLGFDAINDFVPIIRAAELNNVVVVHPSIPVKNIPELVDYARANPGKLSFGSAGTGTTQHLAGEMFNVMTGLKMLHVPYRGAAQAVPDLLGGQTQLMFVSIPDVIAHIRGGKLRAIGVTGPVRADAVPDAPPVSEQDYPDFNVTAWFGVAAPAKTPKDIIDRYNQAIVKALNKPEVQEKLKGLGLTPVTSTPEEFAAFIRHDIDTWAKVVKASGAKVN